MGKNPRFGEKLSIRFDFTFSFPDSNEDMHFENKKEEKWWMA